MHWPDFPNALAGQIIVTSSATFEYNCISHAVCVADQFIWPDEDGTFGWPDALPREDTLQNFVLFFQMSGFQQTKEPLGSPAQWENVAIYVDSDGFVLHAARQMPNGEWTSKLGGGIDISHAFHHTLHSNIYGSVGAFMRRARTGQPPVLPELRPKPPALIALGGCRWANWSAEAALPPKVTGRERSVQPVAQAY